MKNLIRPIDHCTKFTLILLLAGLAYPENLPPGLAPCHRSDPNLADCLENTMQQAIKLFKDGYEPLDIEPIDPLFVPELVLIQSKSNRNFHLSLSYHDFTLKGLSDMELSDFKANVKGNEITYSGAMECPVLIMDGSYDLIGKLLLFDIKGKDKFHMSLYGVSCNFTTVLEAQKDVDDDEYLIVKSTKFKVNAVKKANTKYNNLVQGNPKRNRELNRILEEHATTLQDMFEPSVENFFETHYERTASNIFSIVPFDTVLPP